MNERSLKLFIACIKPILTYGSEIWGYCMSERSQLEQLHLRFCKQALGVSRKASNSATLMELGRYRLGFYTDIAMLKYWCRVLLMDDSSILNLRP